MYPFSSTTDKNTGEGANYLFGVNYLTVQNLEVETQII